MDIQTNKLILISKLSRAITKETGVVIKLSESDVMEQLRKAMPAVKSIETKSLYAELTGEKVSLESVDSASGNVLYRGNTLEKTSDTEPSSVVKKKKIMYRGRSL